MNWKISFLDEAIDDFSNLDHSQQIEVAKALDKVKTNPLPLQEGGYGKPLGGNLAGCCKVKLKKSGIRIVYKIERIEEMMTVVVIGFRKDLEVYKIAENRIKAN